MTDEELIARFGLPANPKDRSEIQRLLREQLRDVDCDIDIVRCLCLQLFSIGHVEDALLIWQAKQHSFDLSCGVDVQLLCGSGLNETQSFLASHSSEEARSALEYLEKCEASGDFDDWSVAGWIENYRDYYGLDQNP